MTKKQYTIIGITILIFIILIAFILIKGNKSTWTKEILNSNSYTINKIDCDNNKTKLDNSIIIVHSVDELLDYIKRYDDEVMIIGGASVYKEMLEYSDKLILTEIDATHDADVYFPSFNKEEWDSKVVGEQEENNIKYKHLVYTRKNNKNN